MYRAFNLGDCWFVGDYVPMGPEKEIRMDHATVKEIGRGEDGKAKAEAEAKRLNAEQEKKG